MPADLSKSTAARLRRSSLRKDPEDIKFDSSHAREIELKRSRGEISCAECRRLKIRCDKTIPCQSCQRRGCAALCPNGSLATGQGTRFVLAATEHLHRKIAKMGERIRQLEDALAILQAKFSNEPHPLLSGDEANNPVDHDEEPIMPEQVSVASGDIIDAFGTLSVTDHGTSRFFGPTGGTEYLLFIDSEVGENAPSPETQSSGSLRDSHSPPLSSGELARFAAGFPLTPKAPGARLRESIESQLPSYDRACHLAESYLEHAAWLFRGVSREQVIDELIPFFYKRPRASMQTPQIDYSSTADLALIFFVFAVGAQVDLNQAPYNAEGDHYFQVARAALCMRSVLEKPSLATIQSLHLASIYNAMGGNEQTGGETSMETSWGLVSLAAQLSQSIGLHRDSSRWGLPDSLNHRRRVLFWDLFVADAWQSMTTGRPPSFSKVYIDCKFPSIQNKADEGEPESDFESWGFRFALECVSEVSAKTLTAEAPSYETIMELDRKVREYPIPPEALALLQDSGNAPEDEQPSLAATMQRFVLSHTREVILLHIHRSFFAQAISDCPVNPLRSQYAPSFLAAYRASDTILKVIRDQFAVNPNICARFWSIWTFAFSAAVVFGTVVTHGPRSPLAATAMSQLDNATELFTQAARYSRRAAKALPILVKLSEKAHYALTAAQSDQSGGGVHNGALWSFSDEVDELNIFAGRTTLVATKSPSRSPSQVSPHSQSALPEAEPFEQQPQQMPPPSQPTVMPSIRLNPAPGPSTWTQAQPLAPAYQPQSVYQSHSNYEPGHHDLPPLRASYEWSHPEIPVRSQASQSYSNAALPQYRLQAQDPAPSRTMSHSSLDGYRDVPQGYSGGPAFQGLQQIYEVPPELVDLGLTSRDSRLDVRWTSFMHETGVLDGINFRT